MSGRRAAHSLARPPPSPPALTHPPLTAPTTTLPPPPPHPPSSPRNSRMRRCTSSGLCRGVRGGMRGGDEFKCVRGSYARPATQRAPAAAAGRHSGKPPSLAPTRHPLALHPSQTHQSCCTQCEQLCSRCTRTRGTYRSTPRSSCVGQGGGGGIAGEVACVGGCGWGGGSMPAAPGGRARAAAAAAGTCEPSAASPSAQSSSVGTSSARRWALRRWEGGCGSRTARRVH